MNSFYMCIIKLVILFTIMTDTINAKEKNTNKLIHEDSPYLQQHANNPVNWYAWGKEAFDKAMSENKMIFLSIGYSTCHWCHVMEEESFENKEVAKILNKYFISIKVDREEMPHVDKYYQDIYYLLNKRSGGWPLTIILTPQRKAFYAATYIPPYKKYGRSGIIELLNSLQSSFENDKARMYEIAKNIERVLNKNKSIQYEKKQLSSKLIKKFVHEIEENYDYNYYGIGSRPKFPHTSTIETLLDIYSIYKKKSALRLATNMLKAMANGGIYDQIEGGFYRYSVDEKWMIPHFEKMLYTNAELLSAYSKAYNITKDIFFKGIAKEIINFIHERFEKEKLLFSASDADSLSLNGEKEEGAYFVFSYDEIIDFLNQKDYEKKEIEKIINYFNFTFEGNFENGLNNPYLKNSKVLKNLSKVKKDLKELRSKKPYPFIDHKILTSWNAMYISSLFEAKTIDIKNAKKALSLLDRLLQNLYVNKVLYHQKIQGKKPKVLALLEDYAFLVDSLLKAYDFSLNEKYLKLALKLNNEAIKKFYKNKIWQMSDDEFKTEAAINDSSYKSALSVMVDNLLKLALLNGDLKIQELAKNTFTLNSLQLSSRPSSVPWFLRTYMAYDKQYISLKASKENLKTKDLSKYIFVLKKANDENNKYLACKVDVCFAFSNSFDDILAKIEQELQK